MIREKTTTNVERVAGNGLWLAYREWNHEAPGLPIVLLHGIVGSGADWRSMVRHLDGRRLIALDARGHGQSDWSRDEEYSGDQHFADVSLAMENLGIERCVVAGFSMGGGVAIMAAAALPERVAGTAIIDAYPHPNMTPGSRRIAGWVSNYDPSVDTFDPAISRHFREQLAAGREDRLDLWPLWEAIECPALVVRGGLSDVLTADNAAEMIARQPRADLVTFEDVGHRVPMQRPRELADLLEAFALRAE